MILSLCAGAILSCAATERPEAPVTSPPPADRYPYDPPRGEQREIEGESTLTVATALLRQVREDGGETDLSPTLGMAILEINPGRVDLRIDAQLDPGAHHVYLLEEVVPCSGVDPDDRRLFGPIEPLRPEYLGTLESPKGDRTHYERRLENGVETYESVVGRPLVLVQAEGKEMVCGVFGESSVPVEEISRL